MPSTTVSRRTTVSPATSFSITPRGVIRASKVYSPARSACSRFSSQRPATKSTGSSMTPASASRSAMSKAPSPWGSTTVTFSRAGPGVS